MRKALILSLTFLLVVLSGCTVQRKLMQGRVTPTEFREKIAFTTMKGVVLIPCTFEGETKNYLFDTGSQVTGIQRVKLKGKKVSVRGATNRTVESGTEILNIFQIGEVTFRKTFATNSDMKGLKEQIPDFGGILGRSIIDKANWLLDMPDKTFILSNKDLADDTFTPIPLNPNYASPYTKIEVEGSSYDAILDLGSIAMLNVPEDTELAKELLEKYDFQDQARERYTVGGLQSITQQVAVIPEVQIGGMAFKDVEVTINQSSQLRIGINMFKDRVIYIDNLNRQYRVK